MPITFRPTRQMQATWVFEKPTWEEQERVYQAAGIRLPRYLSPWDVCERFMEEGYLPPFEVVRQLHEEEVKFGDVARKLWILRGARRTARVVEAAGRSTLRQVHQLKQSIHRWR